MRWQQPAAHVRTSGFSRVRPAKCLGRLDLDVLAPGEELSLRVTFRYASSMELFGVNPGFGGRSPAARHSDPLRTFLPALCWGGPFTKTGWFVMWTAAPRVPSWSGGAWKW